MRKLTGHAITDDNWTCMCEDCGRIMEFEGFFDPEDECTCDRCGNRFKIERIVFDDGTIIE